jgi:hypothetical protein
LALPPGGLAASVLAATGVARAAAPASVAPFRKLRRPASGELLRFGIGPSRKVYVGAAIAPHGFCLSSECRHSFIVAILLELLFWQLATGRPTNLRSGYGDIE